MLRENILSMDINLDWEKHIEEIERIHTQRMDLNSLYDDKEAPYLRKLRRLYYTKKSELSNTLSKTLDKDVAKENSKRVFLLAIAIGVIAKKIKYVENGENSNDQRIA